MAGRRSDGWLRAAAGLVLAVALILAGPAVNGVGRDRSAWAQAESTPLATPIVVVPTATPLAGEASSAVAPVPASEAPPATVAATPEPGTGTAPAATATSPPAVAPPAPDASPAPGATSAPASTPADTPTVPAGTTTPLPAEGTPLAAATSAAAVTAPSPAAGENSALVGEGTSGPGRVLYADNFASASSGWPLQSSDAVTRRVGYVDGEYVVARLAGSGGSPFVMREERFGDFLLQVDARLVEPTTDAYVFLDFRRQQSGEHYSFVVAPDEGSFIVRRNNDREGATVLDWTRSAAIQRGAVTNRLGVRAQGGEVALLVNGEEVGRARVDELREGGIGFGVGSLGDGPAEARFTNLLVVSVD